MHLPDLGTNRYRATAYYRNMNYVHGEPPKYLTHLDGVGTVPLVRASDDPWGALVAETLREAIEACAPVLARIGYDLAIECELDEDHFRRCSIDAPVCRFVGSDERVARGEGRKVLFDLGGTFVGWSAAHVQNVLAMDPGRIQLLAPGEALHLLTQWLVGVEEKQQERRWRGTTVVAGEPPYAIDQPVPTMFVECAGARYSPFADGTFNDVPCWEVHASRGPGRGLICLNWNWDIRARPARGVAFAIPYDASFDEVP